MFSYYGSKSKVVDYYPKPKFDKIIEPFAGSARYSLKWFDREVALYDKYDVIVDIWKYLIGAVESDIKNLPAASDFKNLKDVKLLSKVEKQLIGFCIGGGNCYPTNKGGKFNHWDRSKKKIFNIIPRIKHWTVEKKDYIDIENEIATWFIDPPYVCGGHKYKYSNKLINYTNLAEYSKTRYGHIIVCENTKATWLDFKPMSKMRGCQFTTTEAIWSNYITDYHCEQLRLNL